jgi:hypothetical protein
VGPHVPSIPTKSDLTLALKSEIPLELDLNFSQCGALSPSCEVQKASWI